MPHAHACACRCARTTPLTKDSGLMEDTADRAASRWQALGAKGGTGRGGSGAQAGPHASRAPQGAREPSELGSGVRAHPAHKPTKAHGPLEPRHLEAAPRCAAPEGELLVWEPVGRKAVEPPPCLETAVAQRPGPCREGGRVGAGRPGSVGGVAPPRCLAAVCPKSWRRETLWMEGESESLGEGVGQREVGPPSRPGPTRLWVALQAIVSKVRRNWVMKAQHCYPHSGSSSGLCARHWARSITCTVP